MSVNEDRASPSQSYREHQLEQLSSVWHGAGVLGGDQRGPVSCPSPRAMLASASQLTSREKAVCRFPLCKPSQHGQLQPTHLNGNWDEMQLAPHTCGRRLTGNTSSARSQLKMSLLQGSCPDPQIGCFLVLLLKALCICLRTLLTICNHTF